MRALNVEGESSVVLGFTKLMHEEDAGKVNYVIAVYIVNLINQGENTTMQQNWKAQMRKRHIRTVIS